jgi:hypothetical protein
MPRTAEFVRIAVVVLATAALVSVAHATIVDDTDPQGCSVVVTISNDAPAPDRGLVEVIADLGTGKPATAYEPYSVSAGEKAELTVEFEMTVVEVIEVTIIEDPDPVPTLR